MSNPNLLEGTLVTDYAKIHYYTGAFGYDEFNYDKMPPLRVIREYERKMTDALDSVASLRAGAGETDYNAMRDDPDLRLAGLYEKLCLNIEETLGKQLREVDDLIMIIKSTDNGVLEGFPDKESWLSVYGIGLKYSIDLETLTVSNWSQKIETAFKTTAEDFLNSLRDVDSVEKILEKCNEYFYEVDAEIN